jgi:hypothetical protein
MFLSVVDMDVCSLDVVSGTAYTLCRVQDLDVGAAVLAHSLGMMARQEELVAWRTLQDRHLSHAGVTARSQPKPHDEVSKIHAMRLAISQRVSSSSLLQWPSLE